jgi:predicted O-methyltransferase YrrM
MDLLHPRVVEYLGELARHGDPVLERMEAEARETRFPIVGPAAGQYCYMVARMLGAKRVFELGSGYGYSTIWFARAVRDNGGGEVYHTVWDEALSTRARRNVEEAGLSDIVRFHVGEAVAALRETPGPFDLIFNDIDKQGYPASLPLIKERLRVGGALIIDNMLWHGAIFDESDNSENTRGIHEVTRRIYADKEFAPSLIPIRDGLITAVKIA